MGGSSHGSWVNRQQLWGGDGESWILGGLGPDFAVVAPGGRLVANAVGRRGGGETGPGTEFPLRPFLPPCPPSFPLCFIQSVFTGHLAPSRGS